MVLLGLVGAFPAGHPRLARAAAAATCGYYVRGSICASREGGAACDAVERRLVLREVARTRFPAEPTTDELPYDHPTVDVVLSRVAGARP